MRYPRELIDEIRIQNNIVDVISSYLPLKQKGSSHFGLCPFHNENTPSFSVSADKQLFYCFGCGASGNVISFVMQAENCNFVEAVKILAQRVNIPLPTLETSKEQMLEDDLKERLYEIHKKAGRFYYDVLQSEDGELARRYISERQINPSIAKRFGLGYSPKGRNRLYSYLSSLGYKKEDILKSGLALEDDKSGEIRDRFYNRLMFPIFDIRGRVIGFGGRIMGKGEPKYLNSPETLIFNKKKNLYGLNFAKESKKKELILVEGYMDMLSIYQAGFKNVSASLGTAFNKEHVRALKRVSNDVILIFDSDEAGTNAILRAIPILVSEGVNVKVAQVPDGKDPDEFIKHNGSYEFSKVLVNAKSYIAFKIMCANKKYNLQNTEQKVAFLTEVSKILSEIDSSIERDVYLKEVVDKTGIDGNAIESEIRKIKNTTQKSFLDKSRYQRKRYYDTNVVDISSSKGVLLAQQNILYICATDLNKFKIIKRYVAPSDFIDGVYIKLAEIIYNLNLEGKKIIPADMVNYFSTIDEQKRVSEVFSVILPYNTLVELTKALNEEVRLIKKTKIDMLIMESVSNKNPDEVQRLVNLKKEVLGININFDK